MLSRLEEEEESEEANAEEEEEDGEEREDEEEIEPDPEEEERDFFPERDSPIRRTQRRLARIMAPTTDLKRNFRCLIWVLSCSLVMESSRRLRREGGRANHLCSRQARAVIRRWGWTTSMCLMRSLASSETCKNTG